MTRRISIDQDGRCHYIGSVINGDHARQGRDTLGPEDHHGESIKSRDCHLQGRDDGREGNFPRF